MTQEQPALMSEQEYKEKKRELPYPITIESNSASLYYFGEAHSFDPEDEQWEKDKEFWQKFLEKTEGKSRVAFVEGGTRRLWSSETESIEKDGGMGLITWLAHEAGIEIHSPEPDEAEERAELEKQFSRDEIQYYYFARMAHQWARIVAQKPDIAEYLEKALKSDEKHSGWNDFDFSLKHMEEIHRQLFGTPFDPTATDFWRSIVNPVTGPSVINKVARACSRVRDEHIVQEIIERMEGGTSIFSEYGATHVIMQEPLLRALLEKT